MSYRHNQVRTKQHGCQSRLLRNLKSVNPTKTRDDYFNKFLTERTLLPVGSYVLVNYGDQQPPSKPHAHWRGPFRVIRVDEEDPNRRTVQSLVTSKLQDFPVRQLSFSLENDVDSPEDVTRTDDPRPHTPE